MRYLVALGLGIAGMASAQTTTNTQCTPAGGTIYCNSTTNTPQAYVPPPPITSVDIPRIVQRSQESRAMQDQIARAEAANNAPLLTPFEEELARRMGILIRQSRCADAYQLAVLAGEPEIADESRRACPF
jgi:hypothetical protein